MPLVMREVALAHDRTEFDVFGYCTQQCNGSPFSRSFRAAFDRFVDVPKSSPHTAAEMIHCDGIDILVDVTGHTPGSCLPIMSLRPAPVQVHAIGYGLTTGADYIDYLITDRNFQPPEWRQYCSEKLVYLPDIFLPAVRQYPSESTLTRSDLGLPENAVVFINFNDPYKFGPSMFSVWMRILKRVPDSVLWLGDWSENATANLRAAAASDGVDPGRLIFAGIVKHDAHVARLTLADLALDNEYHGGGVNTADALSAGAPLITVSGNTPAALLGATLSTAASVTDLIASDLAQYEELAVAVALDKERLTALREKLSNGREHAPLFDLDRHRRHLEEGFKMIWRHYRQGAAPKDITVPALARSA